VGGRNSAGQAALHVARSTERVLLLGRGSSQAKGMSEYLVTEIGSTTRIEVRLEWLELRDTRSRRTRREDASALFVLIGAAPRIAS